MSNVFISLINFNGEKTTFNCLDSLDELIVSDYKLSVIVIDNASTKVFKLNKKYKNFTPQIIRSEQNLGFSGGHNLAIKEALASEADHVIILNNDVIVDKNLVTELINTFKNYSLCGIVSPKIYFAKGHEYHIDKYKTKDLGKVIWYAGGKMDWKNVLASHVGVDEVDKGQFDKILKTEFASGCCMMIKRDVFEKIGLFDENYFLYYEDNDFSQRAKGKHFEIYFNPKGIMWHINAGSVGGSGSRLQDYYITRNRIYFAAKYASIRAEIAVFKEGIKLLISGRHWQKQGVKDYFLKKFGKGSFK